MVDNLPDSGVLLKNRAWRVCERVVKDRKRIGIRSYTDYCPAGDLRGVLLAYDNKAYDRDPDEYVFCSFLSIIHVL